MWGRSRGVHPSGGEEEDGGQIPMEEGGLPLGDEVGRIPGGALSRFLPGKRSTREGGRAAVLRGRRQGQSPREEARSRQGRGPRSDAGEEVTILPRSGFENSGWGKEKYRLGDRPPDGALRPGWNCSPLGTGVGEAPGPHCCEGSDWEEVLVLKSFYLMPISPFFSPTLVSSRPLSPHGSFLPLVRQVGRSKV